jgi:hypothetical protein
VSGRLRCILTPAEHPGDYRAEFEATWLKVFYSTHEVVLHTRPAPGKSGKEASRRFEGAATLNTSIGSGTYRCEGMMTPASLRARYDATYDVGTFDLRR